jgi:uncharacterized phage-associated protein
MAGGVMPGYRVEAIANEFIERAKKEGRTLTNMQLQKLPYIAHGWALALLDEPLIADTPAAWDYGPVYRRLYNALRKYGSGDVTDLIHQNDWTPFPGLLTPKGEPVRAKLSKREEELIDVVWNSYKDLSAFHLSSLTHQADSPWTLARAQGQNAPISNEMIKAHFVELAKRQQANAA